MTIIEVNEDKFSLVEYYNEGQDVSVVTPNGDTVNIAVNAKGITHVSLQATCKGKVKSEDAPVYLPSESNNKKEVNTQILGMVDNDFIVKKALGIIKKKFRKGKYMTSPSDTKEFLKLYFSNLEHEVFTTIFLDQRHRLIKVSDMFRGTIDGASVYPREVVKEALKHNAAAVIFAHNHPSGASEPSYSDERITARLKDALNMVDIRVLDHFVVGEEVVSFAERGIL